MSNTKCFCHLNGYEVKDATARNSIENLELTVGNVRTEAEDAKTAANNAASAASAAQSTANEAKTKAATNADNLTALAARVTALEQTETEYVTEMNLAYDSSTESLTIGTEVKSYE